MSSARLRPARPPPTPLPGTKFTASKRANWNTGRRAEPKPRSRTGRSISSPLAGKGPSSPVLRPGADQEEESSLASHSATRGRRTPSSPAGRRPPRLPRSRSQGGTERPILRGLVPRDGGPDDAAPPRVREDAGHRGGLAHG